MKRLLLFTVLAAVWLLASSDVAPDRYGDYVPLFMERAELERSVKYAAEPRGMIDPGKIWIAGDDIFIVERYRGIHIIDNSDPRNPTPKSFIVAPGCMDVAVKNDILYLDNAVDFVAFNLVTGVVTRRIKNFFPEPASPTGERYYDQPHGMILVGWRGVTDNGNYYEGY
ncbi:MAG: hypothetical protein LBV18_07535 [Alistipes sp.]|jgi:hypothetical protein|nr:hypothetical protein [Alistipes sp.]